MQLKHRFYLSKAIIFDILKRQLLFTIGVFILSISFSTPVNAFSLSFDNPFNSFKFDDKDQKQKEIEDAKRKAEDIKRKMDETAQFVKSNSEEISKLNSEISKIAKDLEEKKDMFVTINKYASDAAGNKYAFGNCTAYVKEKRPDIGNFWGNANQWINGAKNAGFDTGDKPKIGAIGVSFNGYYGHVVYIEKIRGEKVYVSEMNYSGFNTISSRTTDASEFKYIYAKN